MNGKDIRSAMIEFYLFCLSYVVNKIFFRWHIKIEKISGFWNAIFRYVQKSEKKKTATYEFRVNK